MMDQVVALLKKSSSVLVATHKNPDGDAIGSLIALGLALEAHKVCPTLYNASPIPAVYRFLPGVERIVSRLDAQNRFEVAVVLDCGNIDRIGPAASLLDANTVIINIDHHVTNTGFGDLQLIDTNACATAEIVYRLIRRMHFPFSKAMAMALYTGILTDTGSFRFSNTNQASFAICDAMVEAGVDPYQIAQHVYGTYSLGRIKLLNLALDSLEISPNGKLSMMTLTQGMLKETGTQSEDIDGMINYAKRIQDVQVAVLIHEQPNGHGGAVMPPKYHVSLRSDGSVDVAKFAAAFGGGGHASAAGFNIEAKIADLKCRLFRMAQQL